MANYTPTFTKPYPSGWVDKPSKTTPVTAAIMNSYDTAISALEAYLRDNAIKSVSADTTIKSGTKIATITIDDTEYVIYAPNVSYESAITGGTKVGTITVGTNTFDVYAPASSTGGSTVSVVPKTLTGTNIAEITVDGTTYQLYAPTSGGGSGSTVIAEATLTEGTQIGKITIDGKETILYAPTASAITVDDALSATSENPVQNKVVKSGLDNLDDSKLKGYKIKYTVPANTGGWHKIAQTTSYYFNFDLYVTGGWANQPKSNAHFQIQNVDGSVRIVQLSGITKHNGITASGITKIRMVRSTNDKGIWILEEFSYPSTGNEYFTFTIAGDVEVTPLDGSVDTSTDFKDSVSLDVSDIPTGTVITTSNIDNALSNESINPVQNKVVKAEFDQVNSNLSELKVSDVAGGKNLVLNTVYGFIAVDQKVNIDNSSTSYIFYAQAGKTYSFSGDATPTAQGVRFAKVSSINPKTQEAVSDFNPIADGVSTFTTNETGYYMLYVYSTKTSGIKFQIEEGAQATDYEPYIPSVKMLASDLSDLKDGTTPVAKAVADEDGNNIKSTYAKKTEAFIDYSSIAVDLNTLTTEPSLISIGYDATNKPSKFYGGYMFVVRAGYTASIALYQILFDVFYNKTYQRKYYHGAWTDWQETISGITIDSALSNTSVNPVQNKIITAKLNEVFQSVSNGKSLVASAITDKGITTAADATFQTMATNIGKISGSGGEVSGNSFRTGISMNVILNFQEVTWNVTTDPNPSVSASFGESIVTNWGGGSNIGINIFTVYPIDLTNIKSMKIKYTESAHYGDTFPFWLGITSTKYMTVVDPRNTEFDKKISNTATGETEITMDVSDISGQKYIYIMPIGYTCTITDLILEKMLIQGLRLLNQQKNL